MKSRSLIIFFIALMLSLPLNATLRGSSKARLDQNVLSVEAANSTQTDTNPPLLRNIKEIAAGYNHACALTTAGGVKCWGNNSNGQLGNNSTVASTVPVDVIGLNTGISRISAGEGFTCALTTAGGVKCWGNNFYGQLGDNSTVDSSVPVEVSGLSSDVASISAGYTYACALTTSGGVECWGLNNVGVSVDISEASRVPVPISGLSSGVSSVSIGENHSCALTITGGVKCWGRNYFGQIGQPLCAGDEWWWVKCWGQNLFGKLGNQRAIDSTVPVDVSGLNSGVSSVSAGQWFTCALLTTGAVKCWGSNDHGELGNKSNTNSSIPVVVNGLSNRVSSISAGAAHICALTTAGGIKCWGSNGAGQLGNNSLIDSRVPVDVISLGSDISSVSAGASFTCALTAMGGVKCWGANYRGQLGNNGTIDSYVPVAVKGLNATASSLSVGIWSTCALTTVGGVKCWGKNNLGQLGNGSNNDSSAPVAVSGLNSGVRSISSDSFHTCALTTTGGVKCWGRNLTGELGNDSNTDSNAPVVVSGLSNGISGISAGDSHTCALSTAGGVKCWGSNLFGELGNNSTDASRVPVAVSGLSSGIKRISAGDSHTCATTTVGGIKCWGFNGAGQLGNDSTNDSYVPVDVVGLSSGISDIDTGSYYTCALTMAGGGKCWGSNEYGQLGNNSYRDSHVPVAVAGLSSGINKISVGTYHACALTTAGEVKCWGWNKYGQLGNNSVIDSNLPVAVDNLGNGVTNIYAGVYHTCALIATGEIKCWGSNEYGQLGNGDLWRTTPVDVVDPNATTP